MSGALHETRKVQKLYAALGLRRLATAATTRRLIPAAQPTLLRTAQTPLYASLARRSLSTATADASAATDTTSPPENTKSIYAELERLRDTTPWWQATFLRLGGVFSEEQWQAAAGSDMYVNILNQTTKQQPAIATGGGVPDRFYTQLQMRGLHCWLAHVRLRDEPKEAYDTLFREMMEKVWQSAELDLTRDFEMGYVQMAKHIKAAQFAWHGLCKKLDEALEAETPREAISAVLLRNVYVDEEGEALVDEASGEPTEEAVSGSLWLADYLMTQRQHLKAVPAEEVLKGRLSWAAVEA